MSQSFNVNDFNAGRQRSRSLREDGGDGKEPAASDHDNGTALGAAVGTGPGGGGTGGGGGGGGGGSVSASPAPSPLINVPRKEPSPSSSEAKKEARSGQLNIREVKALKMGLDMAVPSRDKDQLKEEEEERRAADLEKKKRASQAKLPSTIGTDPPMKRFKILLLGDSGVGKTSLIFRWTLDSFNPSMGSTVGVDFKAKKVSVGGENVQVQVWDTSGQEQVTRNRHTRRRYNTHCTHAYFVSL